MTLHKAAFDIYQVISSCNVHLGDNSVAEAIIMTFIIVEATGKGKIKRIRIKFSLNVLKLHANLLSMSKIMLNGLKV